MVVALGIVQILKPIEFSVKLCVMEKRASGVLTFRKKIQSVWFMKLKATIWVHRSGPLENVTAVFLAA